MTQAPATTVATAVRQHGGGRHPLILRCTAPAGRLQDSRGGVINRRAEGATSSNTLPASCAAAAHPTAGVRRARELSPLLRSQNRPPAQLVEGHGGSPNHNAAQSRIHLDQLLKLPVKTVASSNERNEQGSVRRHVHSDLHEAYEHRQVETKSRRNEEALSTQVVVKVAGSPLHNSTKEINVTLTKSAATFARGLVRREDSSRNLLLYQDLLQRLLLTNQLLDSLVRLPNGGVEAHTLGEIPITVIRHTHPQRDRYGHHQGQNRTNGLHPCRPNFASIHSQHNDEGGRKDHDNAWHRDRQVLSYPLPAALVPHPYHLDDLEHRPSLPALCHHVQRGPA